jgi:toxin ParE1/3/4
LDEIGAYTRREWGEPQCAHYLDLLENACMLLAYTPHLGRPCDNIRPGISRHETGRHVVFFRRSPDGIRVLRFLHERMLPEVHDFEDDEDDG